MLSDTITDKLISFKLRGVLEAYREQQESSQYRDLSFEERFAMLVDREALRRQNLAFQKRVGVAKLRSFASIDEIDFSATRTVRKQQILQLAQPSWIEAKHSLVAIPNPTLADAILDRIIHDTERMEIEGDSMRRVTSPLKRQSNS